MDDGSFTDAAVAPLNGMGSGGVAPSGPGQSLLAKILPQLLPALIEGTGAALTSPIKSGPLIAGRAMLGGLEGWQHATPTQKDLYYQERTQREHERWAQATKERKDLESAVMNTPGLTLLEQQAALKDPVHAQEYQHALKGMPENIQYMAMRSHQPASLFANMDPKDLHSMVAQAMLSDAKPMKMVEVVGGKPYNVVYQGGARTIYGEARGATAPLEDPAVGRSYQYQQTRLTKLTTPVTQQAERMSRLVESVNQRTPQADALIAPELLTAMAGGQGSGLRMTEAEIRRIVGGRSNWEGIQASLNKWKLNPAEAISITEPQRQQIASLVQAMHDRIQNKLKVAGAASDRLAIAKTLEEQRKIVNEAEQEFVAGTDMGTVGKPPPAAGPTASSGADVLQALGLPPRPGGAAAPSSPAAAPPAVAASPDGTRFVQNPATGEVHPLAPGFEVPPGWKQVQ